MKTIGQLQTPSSFNPFLSFWREKNLLLLPGIEGQIYKFIFFLYIFHPEVLQYL
jgi:hypothetical protein